MLHKLLADGDRDGAKKFVRALAQGQGSAFLIEHQQSSYKAFPAHPVTISL